jgi:hypothetical protein
MTTTNEIALKLFTVRQSPQLKLLSETGYCWFDKLLLELDSITGYEMEVETLQNLAYMEMTSETWETIQELAGYGKLLREMEKTGTSLLSSQMIGV